jgi:hypothetical protein
MNRLDHDRIIHEAMAVGLALEGISAADVAHARA